MNAFINPFRGEKTMTTQATPARESGSINCSTSSLARYTVLTWDSVADQYTVQEGMEHPSIDVDIHGLRRALKELRSLGYPADRRRDEDGNYQSDWAVLVERTDDPLIDEMDFTSST